MSLNSLKCAGPGNPVLSFNILSSNIFGINDSNKKSRKFRDVSDGTLRVPNGKGAAGESECVGGGWRDIHSREKTQGVDRGGCKPVVKKVASMPGTGYNLHRQQIRRGWMGSFEAIFKGQSSIDTLPTPPPHDTLDPADWVGFRAQGHRMLDDMLDYLEEIRKRPVWKPIPEEVRQCFREPLPQGECALQEIHRNFMENILPHAAGNAHPGFMGWVHGGGTPVGMLAEMLAAGLNANLGGRDQMPIEVERQMVAWMRELFDFPAQAGGLFVTGTSMANFLAVLAARTAALGVEVRDRGLADSPLRLTAYTSASAHSCIAQAMDLAGIGRDALRLIAVDEDYRMRPDILQTVIAEDRSAGMTPFLIVATAGAVDVGSVDDIAVLADIAAGERVRLHVDGAYGALARLSPRLSPLLAGIERADSIAFDFHKWGQVPYDAGFLLVRDGGLLQRTFSSPAAYLQRAERGLSAGSPWPCDLGLDLSRGFRALKTWFTFKAFGAQRLGDMIAGTCALAAYLKARVEDNPELELMAPVALNVVCFRYRCENADLINGNIAVAIQESGIAVPSTTTIRGCLVIRAAIVNHRTRALDIDALVDATLRFGREMVRALPAGDSITPE